MQLKAVIYRGRVRTIEDAVEAWQSSHADAMAVRDLEDILREWLWATDFLIEWQGQALTMLVDGKLPNIQECGRVLKNAHAAALKPCATLDDWIKRAEEHGYHVDSAERFHTGLSKLTGAREEFLRRWPFPDEAKIQEALAALDRGEGVDVGGWIHELQGTPRAGGQGHD
jgi:hypothetical protein